MFDKLVLINASNLHNGGGVQVATSFLFEISLMDNINLKIYNVVVSIEISNNLKSLEVDVSKFGSYNVINNYGLRAIFSPLNQEIYKYDLVFTIFGPNYLRKKAKKEVIGFAQSWILNFDNPISRDLSFYERNKLKARYLLQWIFFLRSDHYVVELEHVKKSLHTLKNVPNHDVSVVYNTVSSLYKDQSKWKSIIINKGKESFSLGIVTRDYPHKNLDILPTVANILKLEYNLNVHFYVTLNDEEWSTKNYFFKQYVSTVGSLSLDECPSFYQQVDGVIFPSLLECFSATPLEAMVMEKPLFASDRGFVRDVCQEHAIYVDPLDASNIALNIANYFQSNKEDKIDLQQAKSHAHNFSSAKSRAEKYLHIIHSHL